MGLEASTKYSYSTVRLSAGPFQGPIKQPESASKRSHGKRYAGHLPSTWHHKLLAKSPVHLQATGTTDAGGRGDKVVLIR